MRAVLKLFAMMLPALAASCSPGFNGNAAERQDGAAQRHAEADGRMAPMLRPDAAGTPPSPVPAPIIPALDPDALDSARAVVRRQPEPGRAAVPLFAADAPVGPLRSPTYALDLPPSRDAPDPRPFPEEVTRYMVDRDGCDHFRGEEAYDGERRAYLQESISELCTGADARLAMLRQRYAHDPAVLSALSSYEDRIEGNASQ